MPKSIIIRCQAEADSSNSSFEDDMCNEMFTAVREHILKNEDGEIIPPALQRCLLEDKEREDKRKEKNKKKKARRLERIKRKKEQEKLEEESDDSREEAGMSSTMPEKPTRKSETTPNVKDNAV